MILIGLLGKLLDCAQAVGARLAKAPAASADIEDHLKVLRTLGHPYSDADIAGARKQLEGKTEQDALIAYLQVLGTSIKTKR